MKRTMKLTLAVLAGVMGLCGSGNAAREAWSTGVVHWVGPSRYFHPLSAGHPDPKAAQLATVRDQEVVRLLDKQLQLMHVIFGEDSPEVEQLEQEIINAQTVGVTVALRNGTVLYLDPTDPYPNPWEIRRVTVVRQPTCGAPLILPVDEPTVYSLKIPNITGQALTGDAVQGAVATSTGVEMVGIPPNGPCMLEVHYTSNVEVLFRFNVSDRKQTTNALEALLAPTEEIPGRPIIVIGLLQEEGFVPTIIAAYDLAELQELGQRTGMPMFWLEDTPRAIKAFKSSRYETLLKKAKPFVLPPAPTPVPPAPDTLPAVNDELVPET
ncbi:MAG: hypothetical protein LBR78_02735 [Holosporales bacterium]|jgi:hypothetical protein|nr:hypothetical protein [Holosporales bacterium]